MKWLQSETDRRTAYFGALMLASAGLVMTTLVFRFKTAFFLFLAPLNLTNENVFAAWFSGMLLLLASLHAADGYFRLRSTHFKAALAWCVIAAMLLVLSLDEIGSLHERIELLKTGPILSFVPFLIVLLGGCAWSFIQLWLTPSERPRVLRLILGFGILVSVGGQEIIERIISLPWYVRPFRAALEEGSELAGMLILIHTAMPNSAGLFGTLRPPTEPAFSSVAALRWPIVIGAAVLAWPVTELTVSLDEQALLGHFSDWLAAVLFFLCAALLLRRWLQSPRAQRFPTAGVFLLCVASALCVQIDPIGDNNVFPAGTTVGLFGVELNTRLLLLALCCAGAGESLRAMGPGYRFSGSLLALVGALSATFAACLGPEALWWGYFATLLVGLATFTVLALILRTSPIAATPVSRLERLEPN
ncbi:MAG: hypothetical protein WDO56_11060 [Gammaproteobacteria bacterium]